MNILEIEHLSKHFGGVSAVDNCSLSVEEGSITGLIGPNGAGKTTVFDLITGIIPADCGNIIFENRRIHDLPTFKRAKLGIGRTFQVIRLFPELSVTENIMVTLNEHEESFMKSFSFSRKRKHGLKKQAIEKLKAFDLEEKADLMAKELSYGQQKLLEMIRMSSFIQSLNKKALLLLDEPAAGVNETMLNRITELIKRLHKEGKTILLVEHNMNFVMSLCQKIIVMDHGKEIAAGRPKDIQNNPHVLEAYLGKKE